MRIDNMLCFQAIKHYLNFSEAAEALYISQSALSKQLKAMEDELGVILFDRKYSCVKATPAGEQVAANIENILQEYAKMKLAVRAYQAFPVQKLRIISFCEMAQYGITDLIVSFEQKRKDFFVESAEYAHAEMFNLLKASRTDLLIGYKEFFPAQTAYQSVPLARDDLVVVVNRRNPLAVKEQAALEELRGENFCFPREDASLFEFFNNTCKSAGFLPALTRSDVRLGTIKRYIAANMRVTLQTRTRAENFFYEPEFRILSITNSPVLTLSILADIGSLSTHGRQFVHFAQNYYSETALKANLEREFKKIAVR